MRSFFKSRSKYGNIKTTIGGLKFDSKKEGGRYMELKLLEKLGKITGLKTQQKHLLQPAFKWKGRTYRKIEYIADFVYTNSKGEKVVEDVKSPITKANPVYRLKKKLLLHDLPETIIFIET